MRSLVVLGIVLVGTILVWPQSAAKTQQTVVPPELEKLRTTMKKYQDPVVAIHDGYLSTLGCIYFPHSSKPGHMQYPIGAMGIHFLNPQLVSPVPDPAHPPILLYEPVGGKLHLVGVEWFVPLAIAKGRPTLLGHEFHGPMEGHHPLMPTDLSHYDLHVWLFKENPEGLFTPTNPAVKCPGYAYAMEMESPKMVAEPKAAAGSPQQTASPHQ